MSHVFTRRTVLKGAGLGVLAAGYAWGVDPRAAEAAPTGAIVDTIVFGDSASEVGHRAAPTRSSAVTGAHSLPARVFHPSEPVGFWGGTVAYRMRVDPRKPNYFSIKLFGGDSATDSTEWRLHLFIDGSAVGWYDQGAVDNLDQYSNAPRLKNQFYLHTIPLPEEQTRGKKAVVLEIRSMGRIWSYGNQETFYRDQTTDSRPVYRGYTHTEPYFRPEPSDDFGTRQAATRRTPDDDAVIEKVRRRVLDDQVSLVDVVAASSIDPAGMVTIARGYHWADGPTYQEPRALAKLCEAIDAWYLTWKKNEQVLETSNQLWSGFGRVGLALTMVWDDVQPELDKIVTSGLTRLINPDFDLGSDTPLGWGALGWANRGTVTRDTETKHGGDASIKLSSDGGVLVVGPRGRTQVGSGDFTMTGWVKTDGVATSPALDVLFWNAAGQLVGGDHYIRARTGTTDWQEISDTFPVPDGATEFEVWVRLHNGETAWFDDLSFSAAPPAPASGPVARRDAYVDMMVSSREFWRQNQRHFTNQAQICSLGIYLCNKALRLLAPAKAWPEKKAREWVYEVVGLLPLGGREDSSGRKQYLLGHDYHVYTPKGLSREIGYVGSYGEVSEFLTQLYEAVTEGPGAVADTLLKRQIEKLLIARGTFRNEGFDADGNRTIRVEQTIGWRNEIYPGYDAYGQKTTWEGHPLQTAAVFAHPKLVGWAQEQVADGQLGPAIGLLHTDGSQTVGGNAARLIMTDLPRFGKLGASPARIPVGWGQPDFLFTDEVNAVVALKRDDEVFFAALYYRARHGVNGWARVHLLRPDAERSGTVRERVRYGRAKPQESFEIRDWVCWDWCLNDPNNPLGTIQGGWTPPGPQLHQAFAGRELPRAKTPEDMLPSLGDPTPGVETVGVGKAPFYEFSYAGYHIAMNTTENQVFSYTCPASGRGVDLATGRTTRLDRPRQVGPMSTTVLFDPRG